MKRAFLVAVALTLTLIMSPAIAQAHSVAHHASPYINCPLKTTYTNYDPEENGTLKVEFEVFRNGNPAACAVTELLTYSQINLFKEFSHTGTVNAAIVITQTGKWANQNPMTIPAGKTEWDTTATFAPPTCDTEYNGYGSAYEDANDQWAASTISITTQAC